MYMQEYTQPPTRTQLENRWQGQTMDWSGEVSDGSSMQQMPQMGNNVPMRPMQPAQPWPMQQTMPAQQTLPIQQTTDYNGRTNGMNWGNTGNSSAPSSNLAMQNMLPSDVIEMPTSVSEAYIGSIKSFLNRNKGNYIVANFLFGTQNMERWEGILYDVGNDYLVIYQQNRERYIVCDLYSLKTVEFYDLKKFCQNWQTEDLL